jgi:maleamate amidohydrolase
VENPCPGINEVANVTSRVWDAFLTAQDRASLKERPHQVWGYGERPALVLIDLYRWVFGDRRQPLLEAVKEWPGSCGEVAWNAVPHLQRLLRAAREAQIPVVHVTGLDPAGSGVTPWAESGRLHPSPRTGAPETDKERRHWEIIDEVAPIAGEAVLHKAAPRGFFGTLLMAHLHQLGVDGIILCGESTSGCVRATCVEGRSYRFKMTLVEECIFDRHEAPHAINLFDMHQKYADVLGIDEVVEHLQTETLRPRTGEAPRVPAHAG